MNLPPLLRLALVPIGVAIAGRGLQYLTDESERLSDLIESQRAKLNGGAAAAEMQPAAPEDFPPTPRSSTLEAGKSSAGRRVGLALGAVVAFAAGAAVTLRAQQWLTTRAPQGDAAALLGLAAPCGYCERPTPLLDAFPGHICVDCWTAVTGEEPRAAAAQPRDDEDQADAAADLGPIPHTGFIAALVNRDMVPDTGPEAE